MPGKFHVGIGIILEENGKLLIGKRAENRTGHGIWEFPSGKLELGESPFESAVREGKEELSVKIIPQLIVDSYTFDTKTSWSKKDLVLLYIYCKYEGTISKSHEHDILEWVDINKVPDYFSFEYQKKVLKNFKKHLGK